MFINIFTSVFNCSNQIFLDTRIKMKSSNYQHLEHVNHSNHNELDLGMDEFTQQVVEDDSGNYPTNEVLEISRQVLFSKLIKFEYLLN